MEIRLWEDGPVLVGWVRMRCIIRHYTWAVVISLSQRLVMNLVNVGRVVVHGPGWWWVKERIDMSHGFVWRRSLLEED